MRGIFFSDFFLNLNCAVLKHELCTWQHHVTMPKTGYTFYGTGGDFVGPLNFWLWLTFKFPFFLYPTATVSCTYEHWDLGARYLVPHIVETWWWFSLSLPFLLLHARPHTCHPLSPRWMHAPFPWCSSFISIFFNCGIRELALWSYLQTQCYTTQPSLVTESWKRSDVVPKAGLGSDVPASVARFSLSGHDQSHRVKLKQPTSECVGLMFQSEKCFLLSKQMELMHMSLYN